MESVNWPAVQGFAAIGGMAISLLALTQIRLVRKQIAADHERSRRHRAVSDLRDWNAHLNETVTSARRLVETLSDEQLECLREGRELWVGAELKAVATVALGSNGAPPPSVSNDRILLSAEHAIRLRNLCIAHLNACEISLVGWRHGIADRQILEEQLNYLVDLKRDWRMLENFRSVVVGDGAYPSVAQFVQVVYKRKLEVAQQTRDLLARASEPKRPIVVE